MTMTLTDHERAEFTRLSYDCAKHGRTDKARWFADLSTRDTLPIATYDRAKRYYRGWLLDGFPAA